MKKLIFLTAFMFIVSGMTFDVMGMDNYQPGKKQGWSWGWSWMKKGNPNPGSSHNGNGSGNHNGGGAVGAPLDGGLLLVLGAAGTAYVAARKKKKGIDE